MFLIFSGVSGSGKQTVIGEVMKAYSNTVYLRSVTTRPRREGEDLYYYLTQEEFEKKKANNEFFETEQVHGFWYGILNSSIEELLQNPNILYVKDVDVHGTQKLMNALKNKMKIASVFLEVPDDVLFERLIKRGESEERAKIRLSRGALEREYKNQYDYVIENIDLQKTVEQAKDIVENLKNN